MPLNPQQQEAVTTTEGRVLVLAGAGSGKTRVLVARIAHLLSKGVSPEAILGLTFTNKAAAEMRARIKHPRANALTLCTFHSFCMQILRSYADKLGYTRRFTLYDEKDVMRLVQTIAREEGIPEAALHETWLAINRAKGRGQEAEGLGHIHDKLKQAMRAHNAIDFDGLLTLTVRLFREHPDILTSLPYTHVMIDEYQDTNAIQFELTDLLCKQYGNLCVVGDDDQSIYGWRGAEVKNILDFADAKTIKLEQNYRSSDTILRAANAIIGNNSGRHDKKMWSANGEGEKITIFHTPDEIQEAEQVIYRVDQLRKTRSLAWRDIAILYRSNALSRQFELALMNYVWDHHGEWVRGIPYQVFGGQNFYDRREIKDIAAYLRAILNPRDEAAILRTINLPRRGVGEGTLDKLTARSRTTGRPLHAVIDEALADPHDLPDRSVRGIRNYTLILDQARKRLQTDSLRDTVHWLIEMVDYKRAIEEEVKSDKMRAMKWENVQELLNAIAQYEESTSTPTLSEFLSSTALDTGPEKQTKQGGNAVSLMTFHSSKGLEFPAVFLVGMEDDLIPHAKSLLETGLEEERRLMYVACTRAKNLLTLSMARTRRRMGKKPSPTTPSRFLYEIPKELRTNT